MPAAINHRINAQKSCKKIIPVAFFIKSKLLIFMGTDYFVSSLRSCVNSLSFAIRFYFFPFSNKSLGLITGRIKSLKTVPWKRVIKIPLDVEYVIEANAFPKAG